MTQLTIIAQALIITCIVYAIWYSMRPGEIFGKLGDWFDKHLPYRLHNPVFACPACMCGGYGSVIYWLVWHESIEAWLIVVLIAIGIAVIINKLSRDVE